MNPEMIVKSIIYTIPSATTPGIVYQVSVNPFTFKAMSCNCPARVVCRHMRTVNRHEAPSKPRVRFGPAAPARPRIGSATADDLY